MINKQLIVLPAKIWYYHTGTFQIKKTMTEEQRRQLQQQLWNIANTLRGKMNADEFRDYILGFIFYKYLSEKVERYAEVLLAEDQLKFAELDEHTEDAAKIV